MDRKTDSTRTHLRDMLAGVDLQAQRDADSIAGEAQRMRSIGTIAEPERAEQLSWILFADGIQVTLEAGDSGTQVWVQDDAALDAARDRMRAFLASPADPTYAQAIAAGRARVAAAQQDEAKWRRRVRLARASAHGVDGRGWLTLSLFGASILVAAISQLGATWAAISPLLLTNFPASAGLPELWQGQVWRLFTPIVIHFGPMHLLFNLSMWWSWAQRIETHKGFAFFAPFVLATAAFTNLSEYAWALFTDPYTLRAVGGLSGVLYALFGYAWRKPQIDPHEGMSIDSGTAQWMFGWLLLCMTGVLGSVANVAHVSGLVLGVVWAHLDVAWFNWQKRR